MNTKYSCNNKEFIKIENFLNQVKLKFNKISCDIDIIHFLDIHSNYITDVNLYIAYDTEKDGYLGFIAFENNKIIDSRIFNRHLDKYEMIGILKDENLIFVLKI